MKKQYKVLINFSKNSLYYKHNCKYQILRNITEIHYNWCGKNRIAFESDIVGTGYVYEMNDIEEFEYKIK